MQVLSRQRVLQLSLVFALIYFFSPNGLAQLPGITINFLLKDVLGLTATQAAYLRALAIIGWAIKPLWGIVSDAVPFLGYRRKSYLIFTSLAAALVWFVLGQMDQYSTQSLIILFALSSLAYAFMDVLCDALMVEHGKPYNLTARFQSVQWTAVYIASIIAGVGGGWVAQNLAPQTTFSINALFPLIILGSVIFFLKEERVADFKENLRLTVSVLKETFRAPSLWLLAFFLFFWTFSPSFGAPFFYYAVDSLKFDAIFFGIVASLGSISAAVGTVFYGIFSARIKTKPFLYWMVGVGVAATLFDLVYFTSFMKENLELARVVYAASSAVLGGIGAVSFLAILNAAAKTCLKGSEGTTFALLTSFWNIGLMTSAVVGGFLFAKIGLPPLIVVSALFTATVWILLPFMKFTD